MKTAADRYLLAIDLGSSRVRCLIVDERGKPLGLATAEWRPLAPQELAPLGREISPDATWSLLCRLIKRALRSARLRGSQVTAVAATSQREGVVFLDGDGSELYAGPNTDLRAFMEGQVIDEAHRAEVYRITGHLPSFLFTPAKLHWFKSHRPDLFDRIRWVLSLDAWIAYKLSGELTVERSAAAEIGLLDVERGEWATAMLARQGLPTRLLPTLAEAGQPLGRVTGAAAAATGLSSETLVVVAGPDTQCGLLGMGIVRQGEVGIVAGWSAPVQMVLGRLCLDSSLRTWSGLHLLPAQWVLESSATEAGGAYRWMASTLAVNGAIDVHPYIDRLAARAPVGSNSVLAFLGPRAANMGEVGPRWGGLLFPLLSGPGPVQRGELFRAALENLAFAIKSNLAQLDEVSGLRAQRISFGGGMAQSRTLTRILADTIGREIHLSRSAEVPGLGAAMCAATGIGAYPRLEEAAAGMSGPARSVQPDPLRSLEYRDHYQRWAAVDQALEGLGHRL